MWINAYRVSQLVPGSLALILSDHMPWSVVFWITASFMGVGMITILVVREVSDDALAPSTLREAVVEPFVEFFQRDGIKSGLARMARQERWIVEGSAGVALAAALRTADALRGQKVAVVLCGRNINFERFLQAIG